MLLAVRQPQPRGWWQPCLLKTSNSNFYESLDFLGWFFVKHPSVSIIDTSSLMFWTTFHRSEFMWYDPPETATAVHVNLWVGRIVIHAIGWVANRRISCGKKKKKKKTYKKTCFFRLAIRRSQKQILTNFRHSTAKLTSDTAIHCQTVEPKSSEKKKKKKHSVKFHTLQETNLSLTKGSWEDHFPFPQVGYLSLQDGDCLPFYF